jgi:hypothetical protein
MKDRVSTAPPGRSGLNDLTEISERTVTSHKLVLARRRSGSRTRLRAEEGVIGPISE